MKNPSLFALLIIAALPVAACKPKDEPPPAPNPSVDAQKLDAAKTDAKAAAENLNDYAYAKKTEFVQKMRDELAAVNKDIDDLGAKIAQGGDDVKAAAQPKLDALHAQADKLKVQLDKAEDSTEAGWNDFKASASQDYDDLKKSCNDARQWLADKIAPAKAS